MRETLDSAKAELKDKDYRGALKALKAYKSKGMKSLDAEAKAIREKIMAAGKELIDYAYSEAVRLKYRFYSYGDAMLIL